VKIAGLRTATLFVRKDNSEGMARFIEASEYFEEVGISVRTKRAVLDPNEFTAEELVSLSSSLNEMGYWGYCVSFDNLTDKGQIEFAKSIIKGGDNGFVNFRITSSNGKLDTNTITPSVNLIREISKENDGIDNFRLGFSFAMEQETPFFPYSSMNEKQGFAVGLEYIDLILEVINKHSRRPLNVIRRELHDRICWWLDSVTTACEEVQKRSGMEFIGIDISLAPYPYPLEDQSVVDIIEKLGNVARSRGDREFRFGMNGTMFVHTFLTGILKEIVKSGNYKTTGFNGIMYSVLEDTGLSNRYSDAEVGVSDLLLLSTSCGCGIDMLPLSDRSSQKSISSLFFDIFSISSVMSKPLGIRILPIPNSRPGDLTNFRHMFFTNATLAEVGSGISFNELPLQIAEDSDIEL